MKRIVFALVLVLGVVSLNAANPVRLVKGDVSVFQQEVVANVIIDDHTTKIDRTNQTADVYYGNKSQAEYDKFVDDVDRDMPVLSPILMRKRSVRLNLPWPANRSMPNIH